MKLKPLNDWAVIVPTEAAAMTAGGIYIPDSAKEKPEEGVVESIGPGALEEEKHGKKKEEKKERKFIPTIVKPGDRVLYERWGGRAYTIGGEERILVRERDILGLIERPLQIPASTTSRTSTAIEPVVPSVKSVQVVKKASVSQVRAKAAAKKAVKTKPKKSAKKTAKKVAKKTVIKTAKKTVKKAVKKTTKKTAAKPSKKKGKKAGKKK